MSLYFHAMFVLGCEVRDRGTCHHNCCNGENCVIWLERLFRELDALQPILYAADGTERITLDRLRELVEADASHRVLIADEQTVRDAVKRAIFINTDEKTYRYELGKACLDECCKAAYRCIVEAAEKEVSHADN